MERDPRAFLGYYHWQIYYLTTEGDVLLPEGYESTPADPGQAVAGAAPAALNYPVLGIPPPPRLPSLGGGPRGRRHETHRARSTNPACPSCRGHRHARRPGDDGGRCSVATGHAVQLGRERVRRARQREHHAAPHPGVVNGLTDVVDVHAGREHVVALRANGTVVTWGSNAMGQLGIGVNGGNRIQPGRGHHPEQRDDGVHRALPLAGAAGRRLGVDLGLQLRRACSATAPLPAATGR